MIPSPRPSCSPYSSLRRLLFLCASPVQSSPPPSVFCPSLDCVHRLEGNKKITWPEGTLPSSLKWRECCSTWWDIRICLNIILWLSEKHWFYSGKELELPWQLQTSKLAIMKKSLWFFFKAETIFEPFFQIAPPISRVLISPNSSLRHLYLKFYLAIFNCLLYWVPHVTFSLKFGWHNPKN